MAYFLSLVVLVLLSHASNLLVLNTHASNLSTHNVFSDVLLIKYIRSIKFLHAQKTANCFTN